jgi:hypothetical protein
VLASTNPVPITSSNRPVAPPGRATGPCGLSWPATPTGAPSGPVDSTPGPSTGGGMGGSATSGRPSAFSMTSSRVATAAGSVRQMTLPSSTDIPIAFWIWAERSVVYVSSSRSAERPESTRSSFQARFAASRIPEHMPCPANGGMRCAASPAIRIRRSRQRSAQRAWNV